jgi:cell fate regulator YaaT (PSP1 superfamily)
MTTIVGIRFKDSGKIYYFDPGNMDLHQGDTVIVDTARGPEMAKVAYGCRNVPDSEIVGELKAVIRRAEKADFDRLRVLNSRQDELMARCAEKIQEHGLPMGLVKTEYSFDGSRLTFYFTSEQRVDFRMLVRDLARTFRSRIELRQIGPRDEAKLLGGIGPCGRLLCCATFLPDYARVSIKMAKDQDLPLNPTKISGVCGRLLCCLSYEHQQYVDMKGELPDRGDWVQTPDGPGDVVAVNVLKSTITVRLASSGMQEDYTMAQIREATTEVSTVARHRTRQGITPASKPHSNQYDEAEESDLLSLLDEEHDSLDAHAAEQGNQQSGNRDASTSTGKPKRSSRRRKRKPAATKQSTQQADDTSTPKAETPAAAQDEQKSSSAAKRSRRRKRKPSKKPPTDA